MQSLSPSHTEQPGPRYDRLAGVDQFQPAGRGAANHAALSPSGQFLAAVRGEQALELWDLPANKKIRAWDNSTPIRCVAYRADGLMATGFTLHNPNVKKTCGCGASFSV